MKTSLFYLCFVILFFSCEKKEDKPDTFSWEVVTPSSQQMDENVINSLESLVGSLNNVKSFLIVRNGKIIHEQYDNGAGKDSLLPICSITKRITSSLIGIAIDKSIIESSTTPISDYFPEISGLSADIKWNTITIYHLLNMISGMDWIEVTDLPVFESTFQNPLSMIFGRDIIKDPATFFSYNSPGVHLLSYIIERSTDQTVSDFANESLFEPLNIDDFTWQSDGNNVNNGAAGLELTARNTAKIGLLYLQDGMWENRQIISEGWINESLKTPIDLDTLQGSYLPGSSTEVSDPGVSIGNTWWTMNYMGETVHYGDGYGGQILLILPDYNVIVVMNRIDTVSIQDNINAFSEFFNQVLPMIINSIEK